VSLHLGVEPELIFAAALHPVLIRLLAERISFRWRV